MEESDLLDRIARILDAAGTPMLAREIADGLKRDGIDADRAAVNAALYRRTQQMFVKDAEHRWSRLASLVEQVAEQVVDSAGKPMLAREIAAELKRRGFKVDRSSVNKWLYRARQNALVKDADHRWSRIGAGPQARRRALASGRPRGESTAGPAGLFVSIWQRIRGWLAPR